MQVGCNPVPLFLLELDRSVQQDLLLIFFHLLQLHIKAGYFPLVKDDEENDPQGKADHA